MRGGGWIVALVLIRLGDFVVLIALLLSIILLPPYQTEAVQQFAQRPHDRPVIESMPRVWEARATGVCDFYFDGVHCVVEDLPKEYVDYSAWYVRLP